LTQLISVIATILLSGIFTFVILKAISLFTKLRVSEKEEDEGLDISLHGEDAYPDFSTEEGIAL
jgi:Amt family ammonium transporter